MPFSTFWYKFLKVIARSQVTKFCYSYQGRRNWGGQEGQLPLLLFARRGKGSRSALWVIKYYVINHISSDAFWAKSWGVILNVTWLSLFAFIGKSTHNCRFISSPGSIEVPFGVCVAPPPHPCLFIVPASLIVSLLHWNKAQYTWKYI
jgi:hypothetical protein